MNDETEVLQPKPENPRRTLLRNRNFLWLWGGDAISQLGAQFTGLAIPVLAITLLGATEWQVGLLTAAEALDWGLVNQVVPDAEVFAAAMKLAERLAAGPRQANASVKRLVALTGGALEAHLAVESETIARQAISAEGQEGMNAFLEKRKPTFT